MNVEEAIKCMELLAKLIREENNLNRMYSTAEKKLSRVRKAKYYRAKRNKINY
ncbi:hypothetical protein P3U36_07835 [Staphylococcus pseudintermedius]|uniref:hypothetical protein n=1 Tax=Staphylococcus pseudintermedius TaxID=283734 RepID=UPI002AC8C72F|nr:hypothetical protein [Staphylococcus pseudintermedius]WQL64588.1 hypothetical protein P3U36_07835 [Staphylococcus pseudintermedius]